MFVIFEPSIIRRESNQKAFRGSEGYWGCCDIDCRNGHSPMADSPSYGRRSVIWYSANVPLIWKILYIVQVANKERSGLTSLKDNHERGREHSFHILKKICLFLNVSPLVHGPSSNAEWLWMREIATGVGANHIIIIWSKMRSKILTRDVVFSCH